MVICLERGAVLHMVQPMPLPLTVSCFTKIQIGFTFPVLAHPGSPGQRAIKRVCVCVSYLCACYCVQLSYTTQHGAVLIISPLYLHTTTTTLEQKTENTTALRKLASLHSTTSAQRKLAHILHKQSKIKCTIGQNLRDARSL